MTRQPLATLDTLTRDKGYALLSSALVIIAMAFGILPDGFNYSNSDTLVDPLGGGLVRRLQWAPLFVLAGYILWRRRVLALGFLRDVNPFLVAFFLYVSLSILWSPEPQVTLRKVVLFLGLIFIGMSAQVASWRPDRLLNLLRFVVGVSLVASFIAVIFFPSFGIHSSPGPSDFNGLWHGIRYDKNLLANMAAVGALLGLQAALTVPGRRILYTGYFLLSLLILVKSGGRGSLLAALLAIPLVWALASPPVNNRHWLAVTLLVGAVLAAVSLHFYVILHGFPTYADVFGPIFALVGKTVDLTGRDDIWEVVFPYIEQHWLIGYGYGAFWLGDFGPSGRVWHEIGYVLWQAHNGYLDLLNEVGVLGCSLVIGFFVFHLLQLRKLLRFSPDYVAFHLPLIIVILVTNISESTIFKGLELFTLLLVFASMDVSRRLSVTKANALAGNSVSERQRSKNISAT